MKLAKQVVMYFTKVTGLPWYKFFDAIDEAMAGDLETQKDEIWLIHALLNRLVKAGVSISELKANKDTIKAAFDEEGRKKNGEFFTPIRWAEEAHKYMDRCIPGWREHYVVYEGSAGSGNLVKTANINPANLFLSTLQEDDVRLLKSGFPDATVFQRDFLDAVDDSWSFNFSGTLPEKLRKTLENNEPLVIFMNPPYKSGMARSTAVGNYMAGVKSLSDYDFMDVGAAAYDIFYQFCFQVSNLVVRYHLTNTYFCFFGPLQFYTGASVNSLLKLMECCYEFKDGMCIAAQEFSGTSDSMSWGIGFSIWKARGGMMEHMHKDILLERKFFTPTGDIGTDGRVLYTLPRQRLTDWVAPKGVTFKHEAPVMTSHLTFKGSDMNVKVAPKTGVIVDDALGTLMVCDNLMRGADQSAILSTPTTIQYVSITPENFWRCLASYVFRRVVNVDWSLTKKVLSAPKEDVPGYQSWLYNAVPLFLFEHKSMMSSLRGVQWHGYTDYAVQNKLFFLSEKEVRECCSDRVILEDMEKYPFENDFILGEIENSRSHWCDAASDLYTWCVDYTKTSYDYRKTVNYACSLECADAGFQQLRSGLWDENTLGAEQTKLLSKLRSVLRKDIMSYGFLEDVERSN